MDATHALTGSTDAVRRPRFRVAICVSGAQRLESQALTYLERSLPDGIDIDVFAYLWAGDYKSGEDLSDALRTRLEGRAGEVHAVIGTPFEPLINFPHTNYPETNKPNVMRMYFALKKANDMKISHELAGGFRYDIVVRHRSDVAVSSELDLVKYRKITEDFIVFPEGGHWRGGLNDQFAFSSSRNMDIYSSVYSFIPEHCQSGCPLHPESLLRFHLMKMKVDTVWAPLNSIIVRE